MHGKRQWAAGALHRSRLTSLWRRLSGDRLVIFNYHRIRPDEPKAIAFDEGVFGPTTSVFAEQVRWLSRYTRVLSEEELLRAATSGRTPRGLCTMITFDDGYRDNYTLAYPVLKALGVPAIFFIPTQPIGARELGWWDQIAYLIKKTTRPVIDVDGQRLALENGRHEAIRTVQRTMKTEPAQRTQTLLAHLAEACQVPLPDRVAQDQELMTWDQIREVAADGIRVGAHTHTHRVLATLDEETQRDELARSKRLLEQQLGKTVCSLAYPVGGYRHFTARTKALAVECGYALGFSFNTFINDWRRVDPFDVKRVEGPGSADLISAMTVLPGIFARSVTRTP